MKALILLAIAAIISFSSCYIPRLNRMKRGEYKNRLANKKFEMPDKKRFSCNTAYEKKKTNKKTIPTVTYRFFADGSVQILFALPKNQSESSHSALYRIEKRKLTIAYTETLNGKYVKEKFRIKGDSLISRHNRFVLLKVNDTLQ